MTIIGKMMKLVRRKRNDAVAKNAPKKGRSARNGNAPSPYTKYEKREHRYSPGYYAWKQKVTGKAHRINV